MGADFGGAGLAADGVMKEGISPHPVPLPMGEGTVLHAPSAIQASLLPWGEGQDEGSELNSIGHPALCSGGIR